MGLSPFSFAREGGPEVIYVDRPLRAGEPNPWHFNLVRLEKVKRNLVVEVVYPDALNYEGRKIIVYLNTRPVRIYEQTALDPHFTEGPGPKPFARFEPTDAGWSAAIKLARSL